MHQHGEREDGIEGCVFERQFVAGGQDIRRRVIVNLEIDDIGIRQLAEPRTRVQHHGFGRQGLQEVDDRRSVEVRRRGIRLLAQLGLERPVTRQCVERMATWNLAQPLPAMRRHERAPAVRASPLVVEIYRADAVDGERELGEVLAVHEHCDFDLRGNATARWKQRCQIQIRRKSVVRPGQIRAPDPGVGERLALGRERDDPCLRGFRHPPPELIIRRVNDSTARQIEIDGKFGRALVRRRAHL